MKIQRPKCWGKLLADAERPVETVTPALLRLLVGPRERVCARFSPLEGWHGGFLGENCIFLFDRKIFKCILFVRKKIDWILKTFFQVNVSHQPTALKGIEKTAPKTPAKKHQISTLSPELILAGKPQTDLPHHTWGGSLRAIAEKPLSRKRVSRPQSVSFEKLSCRKYARVDVTTKITTIYCNFVLLLVVKWFFLSWLFLAFCRHLFSNFHRWRWRNRLLPLLDYCNGV